MADRGEVRRCGCSELSLIITRSRNLHEANTPTRSSRYRDSSGIGTCVRMSGCGNSMKFLDLFAGIGGFRLGMEMAGHECVGYVEIDKFARQSYEAIHDTEGEWTAHDITSVTDDDLRLLAEQYGSIDVICGGFPCQAFSIAGKRGGFNDTRGTLFFEIARFASILKPKYLFLENVKGLLNHEQGRTFGTILNTLDELGYDAEWQVLNSKDFGVPQNRERVFIVGHLRGERTREVFPIRSEDIKTHKKPKEVSQQNRVIGFETAFGGSNGSPVFEGYMRTLDQSDSRGVILIQKERDFKIQEPKIVIQKTHGATTSVKRDETGTLQVARLDKVPCVLEEPAIKKVGHLESDSGNTGIIYDPEGIAPTQLAQHGNAVTKITTGYRIRKLTPRECWRLQGFPDWAFDRARDAGVSDSQLYKQAGNSVTVNVIYEIAKRL
jgi:DNA (cytosine-5)-methyltransferase 1